MILVMLECNKSIYIAPCTYIAYEVTVDCLIKIQEMKELE